MQEGREGVPEHEGLVALAGAVFEDGLTGGAYAGFVGASIAGEPCESDVAGYDGLEGGYDVESGQDSFRTRGYSK